MIYRLGLFFFLMIPISLNASPPDPNHIIVTLPDQLIEKHLTQVLPLDITPDSDKFLGQLSITQVRRLDINQSHLFIDATVQGNDLSIITRIGGQEIVLTLGSMEFDLKGKAALQFDSKQQTLFIKPFINDVQSKAPAHEKTAAAFLPLINHVTFPVRLADLDPLTARTLNQQIYVKFVVHDIRLVDSAVQIYVTPDIHQVNQF